MVNKKTIEEIITKSIITIHKCNTSSKARKRGTGGIQEGTSFTDKPFEADDTYSINYPDGTRITFDQFDEVIDIQLDGTDYEYLGHDEAYKEFEYQKKELTQTKAELQEFHTFDMQGNAMTKYEWETEYDFVKTFADDYASSFGLDLNLQLHKGEKVNHYNHNEGNWLTSPDITTDSDLHVKHFIELEKQNRIDHKDIVLKTYVSKLHENDRIDKSSYTSKSFTSTTAGGFDDELKQTFAMSNDAWTIFTVIKKGSNARGLFLGNPLIDSRSDDTFGKYIDWETEVNLPPQTRFTRDLIDEERHIIIQHIEKQRI